MNVDNGEIFYSTNYNEFVSYTGGREIKIRVLDYTTPTLINASTIFGGYGHYVDITNDIADISDRVIAKVPVSLGESASTSTNLGGFCFFQGDTNIVRVCSNRSQAQNIRVTVFYI